MESDVKKDDGLIQKTVEIRLVRLEGQVANIAADVGEVTSSVKCLRTRMDDGFQALRKETHDRNQALHEARDERFRAVHKEIHDRDLALREEMYEGLRSIRKQLSDKEISDTRIWALLIGATILGALARGFHWI
jgi:hypothetical protein